MSYQGDYDPEYYSNNSKLQYNRAQELLHSYAFQGHETILDIGCGDGKITAQMSKYIPQGRAIGIDRSCAMIAFANSNFSQALHPNLSFEVQDIEKLSFPFSFDLITAFNCFHWVKNKKIALQNLHQLLKPSGIALFLTYKWGTTLNSIQTVAERKKWSLYWKDPHPYDYINDIEYKKILYESNFRLIDFKMISGEDRFSGKKDFENFLRGWVPFLLDLPKNRHDEFLEEIGDESLKYALLRENGSICHPTTSYMISAQKR